MIFRTEYKVPKTTLLLSPSQPVVLVGSCFSQNIASKMNEHLWKAVNPLGTLYNPFSIGVAIRMMLDRENGKNIFEKSLFEFNGVWNSHMFDSSFSSSNRDDCLQEFLIRQNVFHKNMSAGNLLIVTFGTSICYHLVENDSIVGNCHKQPSVLFFEKRMGISDIVEYWDKIIKDLIASFPDIKIIFTVSPVRHLKNGFVGNSNSKAVLKLSIEEICENNECCYYFPAFEILNDDLRDYRFYASDLVHPSEEAVEYIWEKFCETFIDKNDEKLLSDGYKRNKYLHHRPKTGALGKPIEKSNHP